MGSDHTGAVQSLQDANDRISWISGYETEADVEAAARQIVEYLGLPNFVFSAFFRSGERENHRYLVGCVPEWCYLYNSNKWYAIDPFIDYALRSAVPILASDVALSSTGQERMMAAAAEYGFRSGVVVPAHSLSAVRIGILYLGTGEGPEHASDSLLKHRHLMRAFAVEMLEWWDTKLRADSLDELGFDQLDLDLLAKVQENASREEAARELGIPLSTVKTRYDRLTRKLHATSKRNAAEKAVGLGLMKPR